jgi:hypothetical protein
MATTVAAQPMSRVHLTLYPDGDGDDEMSPSGGRRRQKTARSGGVQRTHSLHKHVVYSNQTTDTSSTAASRAIGPEATEAIARAELEQTEAAIQKQLQGIWTALGTSAQKQVCRFCFSLFLSEANMLLCVQ